MHLPSESGGPKSNDISQKGSMVVDTLLGRIKIRKNHDLNSLIFDHKNAHIIWYFV